MDDIVESKRQSEKERTAQMVFVSLSVLGFRARVDADTGWKTLRRIRRSNLWLAWGAAAYTAVLVVAVVALATAIGFR
ncbi:hypothetical protein [Streptomyces roseolus]